MEPAQIALVIHTSVSSIEEVKQIVRVTMKEGQAETELENLGWFVLFSGSHERLYVGTENPGLATGDEVEIIIRKKANAQPIQAPV